MNPITIACVYRTQKVYGAYKNPTYSPEYVEKLKRGFERHLPLPHQFVCLTDAPFSDYCIPLLHDWPGWWSKIELFRPGLLTGRVLSVDLDTVLLGDLSALFNHDERLVMMRDRSFGVPNSCLMYWDTDNSHIYTTFLEAPEKHMHTFRLGGHGSQFGDQGFIEIVQRGRPIAMWQDILPPGSLVHYNKDIHKTSDWKDRSKDAILCWWSATPKPRDTQHPLVLENWV
jgi:hypothetical protein